jgi:hypothetical protein
VKTDALTFLTISIDGAFHREYNRAIKESGGYYEKDIAKK